MASTMTYIFTEFHVYKWNISWKDCGGKNVGQEMFPESNEY